MRSAAASAAARLSGVRSPRALSRGLAVRAPAARRDTALRKSPTRATNAHTLQNNVRNAPGNSRIKQTSNSRARRRRKPPKRAPPTAVCVPADGLSARQLGALSNADISAVLARARDVEGEVTDADTKLTPELVELIADDMRLHISVELQRPLFTGIINTGEAMRRTPVVTVMGHVDHGKTTLLDALRGGDTAANEAGGITQRLGAFSVPVPGGKTVFLDTPGHAAFGAMRARGAIATDVVVLAVAADDGVMPQTIEAARLAAAAGVPVVVAITKADTPGARPERVRAQLLDAGIAVEQLGGDVPCVDVSAVKGLALDALMEAIMRRSDALELMAHCDAPARMVCIESGTRRALGPVATVVVRDGTVAPGDVVLFQCDSTSLGDLFGRVRSLVDMSGDYVDRAVPGDAVGIVGLRTRVPPGALCVVVPNEKEAKKLSHSMIAQNERAIATVQLAHTLENSRSEESDSADFDALRILESGADQDTVEVQAEKLKGSMNLVIKGDVQGSADAVAACLERLATKEYGMRVLSTGVGDVTDNDVTLASATAKVKRNKDDALIVAFNVRASEQIVKKAKRLGVPVTLHKLIYHLEDEVKERLEQIMKRWEITEKTTGKAHVVRVFEDGGVGGCSIDSGAIAIGSHAKVWRYRGTDREVIHSGVISSLKHFAKDIRVAEKGSECGIAFADWHNFVSGDVVESVDIVKGSHA